MLGLTTKRRLLRETERADTAEALLLIETRGAQRELRSLAARLDQTRDQAIAQVREARVKYERRTVELVREFTGVGVERARGSTYDVKVIVERPILDGLAPDDRRAVVDALAREVAGKVAQGVRLYQRTSNLTTREAV